MIGADNSKAGRKSIARREEEWERGEREISGMTRSFDMGEEAASCTQSYSDRRTNTGDPFEKCRLTSQILVYSRKSDYYAIMRSTVLSF